MDELAFQVYLLKKYNIKGLDELELTEDELVEEARIFRGYK